MLPGLSARGWSAARYSVTAAADRFPVPWAHGRPVVSAGDGGNGGRDLERWKERGVALRVFIYVFATHILAGFIWLLFYVGGHAPK